jgi:hypothetical protein
VARITTTQPHGHPKEKKKLEISARDTSIGVKN